MTEPFVFPISVIVWTLIAALWVYHGDEHPRVTWQGLLVCLVAGWLATLLIEGFGLYGPYAGPEPHM